MSKDRLYIALDKCNLDWWESEVKRFQEYWGQGYSFKEIAKMLRRSQKDVLALMLDQTTEELVSGRHGGYLGNEWGGKLVKKSG